MNLSIKDLILAWFQTLGEAIKILLCSHDFEFRGNLHDDKDCSRLASSYWHCRHCPEAITKPQPYHKDPKTKRVRPMSDPERAYQHGYMSELLRKAEDDSYLTDPALDESYHLGRQIAKWDEEDRTTKDGARFPV